jgi:hypothetical protein
VIKPPVDAQMVEDWIHEFAKGFGVDAKAETREAEF